MSYYLFLINKDVSKVDFILFIYDFIYLVLKRELNSYLFYFFVMSLFIFCFRFIYGSVCWVIYVVFGLFGVVFNEIQVLIGGVQGVIVYVYSFLYIFYIILLDLDNGVIGQLGKMQKKVYFIDVIYDKYCCIICI